MSKYDDLIPSAEAAEMLDVSLQTIHRYVREGKVPVAVQGPGKTSGRLFDRRVMEGLVGRVRERRKFYRAPTGRKTVSKYQTQRRETQK